MIVKRQLEKLDHCHNSSLKKDLCFKEWFLISCYFGTWDSHFPNCKPGSNTFELHFTWKVYIQFSRCQGQQLYTFDGKLLLIQLIYQGNSQRYLPKFDFPDSFSISFAKWHWSNTVKSIGFWTDIFLELKMMKEKKGYPNMVLKEVSAPIFLRHPPFNPACLPFLKSLFLLPSFLFHLLLRYFRQFPTPSHNPPALIGPTNLPYT